MCRSLCSSVHLEYEGHTDSLILCTCTWHRSVKYKEDIAKHEEMLEELNEKRNEKSKSTYGRAPLTRCERGAPAVRHFGGKPGWREICNPGVSGSGRAEPPGGQDPGDLNLGGFRILRAAPPVSSEPIQHHLSQLERVARI